MSNLNRTLETLNSITTSKNLKKVSLTQLNENLSNVTIVKEMASFGSVIQLTEPKCNKKDRKTKEPFVGKIQKLSYVPSIIVNSKYDTQYQRKLTKLEIDETYKTGINTMPLQLCENNDFYGTFYGKSVIQYRPNPNENSRPTTYWFLNGKLTDKNDLPDVLPTSSKGFIGWRKLYTSNVIRLTLGGVTYEPQR